jgi:hypothetical protein
MSACEGTDGGQATAEPTKRHHPTEQPLEEEGEMTRVPRTPRWLGEERV